MQIKDKQYYIYIRSARQRVYVTKEQFEEYYREINTFRMKQKRHKRCSCPKARILDCDMDCGNCPYAVLGDTDSLNDVIVNKDGNESIEKRSQNSKRQSITQIYIFIK